MKLSDQDVVDFCGWYYGARQTNSPTPSVLDRIVRELPAARRRLFAPEERHLVVLEVMFLARNGAEAVGRDADTSAVPLHRNDTVTQLGELGLLCVVTTSEDFPDGLWRITDEGVECYLNHAPRIPINPDETADRTIAGSGRSRRDTGIDSAAASDARSTHEANRSHQ